MPKTSALSSTAANPRAQKLIVANWKSNKTQTEASNWFTVVGPKAASATAKIVVCPPYPFLPVLNYLITSQKFNITLGVQDVSPFPSGSYTGAVSVRNLEGQGVKYAIVGHSERRKYFGETNQTVANKVSLLLEEEIMPIVCVEESGIVAQAAALEGGERKKVVVAFEPSGHIGTGDPDSLADVLRVAGLIRASFADDTQVLYGGSVDEKNCREFLSSDKINGALVGTASLDANEFLKLFTES
jgi:triosephosphate isomerase